MQNPDFCLLQNILKKYWHIILFSACFAAIAVGICSKLWIPPVYRSSVSLYFGTITENTPDGRKTEKNNGEETSAELKLGNQLSEDYLQLVNSDIIREGVQDQLAMHGKWQKKGYQVKAEQIQKSRIMKICIDSCDPLFSQEAANIYALEFIRKIRQIVGVRNIQIIEDASLDTNPVSPQIHWNIAGGFAAGFFFSLVVIIICTLLDSRIRTPEETEYFLPIPLFGVIRKTKMFSDRNPGKQIPDDFRVLSLNLENRSPFKKTEGILIAITSPLPGDGKTFCAEHLGTALKERNHKVLQIRFDETPSAETCGSTAKTNAPGNVLPIEKRSCNEPDVLSAAADLTLSPEFRELLQSVREKYDYILLDVPGRSGFSHTVSACSAADMILLLIRAGKTDSKDVKRAADGLLRANLNVSGIILNGLED